MLLRGTALGNLSLAVNHLEERMSAVWVRESSLHNLHQDIAFD